MELVEASEWGATKCVGSSPVLYLCQGARFRLQYDDDRTGEHQEAELVWMGMRAQVEFTLTGLWG